MALLARRWSVRGALTAVLAIAALLSVCASGRADIRVITAGGGYSDTVNLSEFPSAKEDVSGGVYSDISEDGGPSETVTVPNGYSLQRLFGLMSSGGLPVPSFGAVEVPVPGGRSVVLNPTQATNPGAYADGPPVVWQDASGTHFLVPSSPNNPGELVTGGTITIKLYSGAALSVGVYVPPTASIGKPLHFDSHVAGALGPYDYSWQFGDQTGSSLPSPTHTYTAAGVYTVFLRVMVGDQSLGQSVPTTVTVGTAPIGPATQSGVTGGLGSGASGSGTGQGSAGTGLGTGAPTSQRSTSALGNHAAKRSHARAPRPTGPVVSGIALTNAGQVLTPGAVAAAGAAAARAAHVRASTQALDVGMWIWFAVLAMLFGGALLEWAGPRRARLAMHES